MQHFVGKWDAGMATPKHTPQGRGYDTSLNYFEHKNDFWNSKSMQTSCGGTYDLWDTDQPAKNLSGKGYGRWMVGVYDAQASSKLPPGVPEAGENSGG